MYTDERGYKFLEENEHVVFPSGKKADMCWATWSKRAQAFEIYNDDLGKREFSNDVRVKEKRKGKKFVPSAKTCTVKIYPEFETEKAYAVATGDNGCVVSRNCRTFYNYIAKSICYVDEEGNIYKPTWA